MTGRSLTIEKRGALFYLVSEDGVVRGLGYANRHDAEEALRTWLRSSQRSIRACISCGRSFESSGSHNRMCPPCRTRGG